MKFKWLENTSVIYYCSYLGQFHFQHVAAMNPTVKVSYFFGGGLNLGNDLHVREHNHSRWEQEAEEEDVQDENLTPNWGLGQPPVQGARGSKGLRYVVPQTYQGHGGPEGSIGPDDCQADVGMLSFQPNTWRQKKSITEM